jgi:DeoR family glycerol-3-phosphate regulon repressor
MASATPLNARQRKILSMLKLEASASVEHLAKQLDVTSQTIRRDVKLLQDEGLIQRYHGGVSVVEPVAAPDQIEDYGTRQVINADAKRRIALAVAARLPSSCSAFINIGTTTEEVARALLHHSDLHVVTNNLNVAAILSDNPGCEIIIAGGIVRNRDKGIVGDSTVDFIEQFKVDVGIIGTSSIELDGTLRDFDPREVRVAQSIVKHSREVWLVADGSKIGRSALVRMGHVADIDVFFTDVAPPPPLAEVLAEKGVAVVIAA